MLDFKQKYLMLVLMKIIAFITIKCFWKNIHINNTNMLYYDTIDISEGIYVNKTIASK